MRRVVATMSVLGVMTIPLTSPPTGGELGRQVHADVRRTGAGLFQRGERGRRDDHVGNRPAVPAAPKAGQHACRHAQSQQQEQRFGGHEDQGEDRHRGCRRTRYGPVQVKITVKNGTGPEAGK